MNVRHVTYVIMAIIFAVMTTAPVYAKGWTMKSGRGGGFGWSKPNTVKAPSGKAKHTTNKTTAPKQTAKEKQVSEKTRAAREQADRMDNMGQSMQESALMNIPQVASGGIQGAIGVVMQAAIGSRMREISQQQRAGIEQYEREQLQQKEDEQRIKDDGWNIAKIPPPYSPNNANGGGSGDGLPWQDKTAQAGDPCQLDPDAPECQGWEKNPTKASSPVWKKLKQFRGSIRTNGKRGKAREFYEWDYTHNDIEVYDSKGFHKGSMNPRTGRIYKSPVKGRDIVDRI